MQPKESSIVHIRKWRQSDLNVNYRKRKDLWKLEDGAVFTVVRDLGIEAFLLSTYLYVQTLWRGENTQEPSFRSFLV